MLAAAAALLARAAPAPVATLALLPLLDDAHALSVGSWPRATPWPPGAAVSARGSSLASRWRTRAGARGLARAAAGGRRARRRRDGAGAVLAYLVAWELCRRRRRPSARSPPRCCDRGILRVLWLTQSGPCGSGAYLEIPSANRAALPRQLPGACCSLPAGLLLGSPLDLALGDGGFGDSLKVRRGDSRRSDGGGLAARGAAPDGARRGGRLRSIGLAERGALVVSTPGLPGERLLLAAGLGGAVVIAALLRDAWTLFPRPTGAGSGRRWGSPSSVCRTSSRRGRPSRPRRRSSGRRSRATGAWRAKPRSAPPPARVVVVAFDDLFPLYLFAIRAFEEHRTTRGAAAAPPRLALSGDRAFDGRDRDRLRRTAADELVLSTDGTFLDGIWAELFRAPSRPLARGAVLRSADMTATVLDDRDGRPALAFRFDRPLEIPSLVFLVPAEGRLRRLDLPPIGGKSRSPGCGHSEPGGRFARVRELLARGEAPILAIDAHRLRCRDHRRRSRVRARRARTS